MRSEKGRFVRLNPVEYFNARTAKDGATGCWNWTGTKFGFGHGVFKCKAFHPTAIPASRASWIMHRGPIPDGLWVLHRCDNPSCVNPAHLFLGTCQDNVDDMVAKERNNRGEDRPEAKLTEDAVRKMRDLRRWGVPFRIIAAEFGVSLNAAVLAIKGETWKHVI